MLLVLMLTAATACNGSGEISGDFYYTTKGGDVVRLADHEILLVRATLEFDAAWAAAVDGHLAERGAARYGAELRDQDPYATMDILREIDNTWKAHALELVVWSKPLRVQTNVTGHFTFPKTATGRHYLFASHGFWWTPIDIKAGSQTFDLTPSNRGSFVGVGS